MIPITKPFVGKNEADSAYSTILSGWITQGPKVEEFEDKFSSYVGAKHSVAVTSCTSALHLSLIVAGIKKEDEVICPSMSYIATANTIKYAGAKPIFAEVSKHSYNLDLDDVIKRITPKTKAIVLVHQMGKPAELEEFQKLCTEQNLLLIEDAACAIGSEYKGKKIGSHSNFVCFSFHPRKIITTGEGGMICTNDDEIAKRLRLYRQHGMSINDRVRHEAKCILKEDHLVVGYNYRLTDIQAAIGIEQLKRIDDIISLRRNIAQKYNDAFSKIPFVKTPHENSKEKNNFQTYPLYLENKDIHFRDKLMNDLLSEGIATRRGIMTAHRETAYGSKEKISLPITEDLSDKSICLPLFPELENQQIQKIINSVSKLLHN